MKKWGLLLMLVLSFVLLSGFCLWHDWLDASCEYPQICRDCGETKGEPRGHSFQAATCEEPEACGACGTTRGEALGHDVEGLTCATDGMCVRCGHIEKTPGHVMLPANREQPVRCRNCSLIEGEPIDAPWYAGLNAFAQLKETDIGEMGSEIGVLSTHGDEIEYTIHQDGAQILHDDGERALLLGDTMLYLCTREGSRAVIRAAIQTSDFLRIDSIYSEGIERAQNFGDGVMFTTTDAENNYCVYYLDWPTLTLRKLFRSKAVYPSFDADYWICGNGDKLMVIDFGKTRIHTGSCELNGWNITRVTSNGAVIYNGKKPERYLCFENMALFDTLMEGSVAYAGDDYYIRIADFALEFIKEDSSATWIKRIDDPALQGDETYYQAIGNLLYFASGGAYSRATLVFMSQGEDEASEYISQLRGGLGYASAQRRYMALNASQSLFSNWYIMKLGTNEYIKANEAA